MTSSSGMKWKGFINPYSIVLGLVLLILVIASITAGYFWFKKRRKNAQIKGSKLAENNKVKGVKSSKKSLQKERLAQRTKQESRKSKLDTKQDERPKENTSEMPSAKVVGLLLQEVSDEKESPAAKDEVAASKATPIVEAPKEEQPKDMDAKEPKKAIPTALQQTELFPILGTEDTDESKIKIGNQTEEAFKKPSAEHRFININETGVASTAAKEVASNASDEVASSKSSTPSLDFMQASSESNRDRLIDRPEVKPLVQAIIENKNILDPPGNCDEKYPKQLDNVYRGNSPGSDNSINSYLSDL